MWYFIRLFILTLGYTAIVDKGPEFSSCTSDACSKKPNTIRKQDSKCPRWEENTEVASYLYRKLWRTASGDLRLFWLLQSRRAPAVRPEPPCLLLLLLHHLRLLSSRCCPCQHSPPRPSCTERHGDMIANAGECITSSIGRNNKQGLAQWQHLPQWWTYNTSHSLTSLELLNCRFPCCHQVIRTLLKLLNPISTFYICILFHLMISWWCVRLEWERKQHYRTWMGAFLDLLVKENISIFDSCC